ncbi:hypothetical protein Tco_0180054 [Tanacetum coccineum]
MEYVKKSIDERALHKREHDSRVNERQIQTTMEKVDTSKALDASSVIIKSNGTESQKQDTSSRSGNDAHVDDADIRPIYMMKSKGLRYNITTLNFKIKIIKFLKIMAKGQQHTEQPEFINEGEVDQNTEQCHDTCPLPVKLTDDKTIELSNQLLESKMLFSKRMSACVKRFSQNSMAHCINLKTTTGKTNVLKSGQRVIIERGRDELVTLSEKEALETDAQDIFDSSYDTSQTKSKNDSLMEQPELKV